MAILKNTEHALPYARIKRLGVLAFACVVAPRVESQTTPPPDTVKVCSGSLALTALLWRPPGPGPFPAVLFNHGSYRSGQALGLDDPSILAPLFVRHGYIFLVLFRRGVGPSAAQGTPGGELMARALADAGHDGRNRVQLELLQHEEMGDALAGLEFLRRVPGVDTRRVVVAGHSFGGSLTLLLAADDTAVRAVVVFGAAATSWDQSSELRARLQTAVSRARAPVLFIHAANDYSVKPGTMLAAEMQRLHKPHRLVIYPAVGATTAAGHNLVFRSISTWESDVFAFLEAHLHP